MTRGRRDDADMLSVAEACKVLSIGRSKFYEAVAREEIRIKKLGKKSLVAHSDLVSWASRLPDARRKPGAA